MSQDKMENFYLIKFEMYKAIMLLLLNNRRALEKYLY